MELHVWKDVDRRGTIQRHEYTAVNRAGERILKYANVYLPYDYSPCRKYDILYLMHGGGGNPDAWLDCSQIKNALDLLFDSGKCRPFLAVFPTYYTELPSEVRSDGVPRDWERENVLRFQKELREKLIPSVESAFSTYAENCTEEALIASRQHRAFGGFSMGAATTWFAFLENRDLISRFVPLSGDCWVLEPMGGRTRTEATVQILCNVVTEHPGYEDFRIFAATGAQDIAYPAMVPQIGEMRKHEDIFTFSEDLTEGNLHFCVKENSEHKYEEVYHHVYHYAPYLFD